MTVYFYTFGKRYNSTKQPTGGTTYDCKLIQPSGVLNPSITLDLGATGNPTAYNYAYIGDYGRYYWVDEWTSNLGFWTARLSVDPLASWKTYIGDTTCMVLRCASEWDDDLIDTLYPTKAGPTVSTTTLTSPWTGTSFSNGRYVLGIAGNNSTKFYSFTSAEYSTFMTSAFDLTWLDNLLGGSNILNQVPWMRGMWNPLQYITSAIWIPFVPSGTDVGTVPVGLTSVTCSAREITTPIQQPLNLNINVTNHPQVSSRGAWMKNEPYTHRTLLIPPFGDITLASEFFYSGTQARINVKLDVTTGETRLLVTGPHTNDPVLIDVGASVAVPIIQSQTYASQNMLQTAGGIGTGLAGSLLSGIMGNKSAATDIVSGIMSLPASIASATLAQNGSVSTNGSQGSAIGISATPRLTEMFWEVTESAAADRGRPLCKLKGINTLAGYIQILDGEFPIPCTDQELRAIKTFTEGGFFYE